LRSQPLVPKTSALLLSYTPICSLQSLYTFLHANSCIAFCENDRRCDRPHQPLYVPLHFHALLTSVEMRICVVQISVASHQNCTGFLIEDRSQCVALVDLPAIRSIQLSLRKSFPLIVKSFYHVVFVFTRRVLLLFLVKQICKILSPFGFDVFKNWRHFFSSKYLKRQSFRKLCFFCFPFGVFMTFDFHICSV
jgi:hypothetical protein